MRRNNKAVAVAVGVFVLACFLLYVGVFRGDRGAPPAAPAARPEAAAPTIPGTAVTQGPSAPRGEPRAKATKPGTPQASRAGAQPTSAPAVARSSAAPAKKAAAPAVTAAVKAAVVAPVPAAKEPEVAAAPTPTPEAAPSPGPAAAVAPAEAAAAAPADATASGEAEDEENGPSGAIAGILLDGRGVPLATTSVLAVAANGADARETVTDDEGAFLLPGLRPGRYAVFPGFGTPLTSRLGVKGVTVKSRHVVEVSFSEARGSGAVRVTSVGDDGRPTDAQPILIADAPREAGGFGSLLAADALFLPEPGERRGLIRYVPPGTYRVVLLRGVNDPTLASPQSVRVVGDREVGVTVHVGGTAVPRG